MEGLFSRFAESVRQRLDARLAAYTDFGPECPARLREAIRYSLLGPGKRLRPLLALMAAEACGSPLELALPAACAVEMVHAYSLIHDDLPAMDDDDLRRGRPTCHKQFDEATAILAGDALLALAFEALAKDVRPPDVAAACCAALAEAAGATALVGGQADDLSAEFAGEVELGRLESIHARKTGAMIRVSLRLGALAGQAGAAQAAALESFGEKLGLAFQISDDLLDVRGAECSVGKRVGKDAARGKLTFPGLLGVDESLRRLEELLAAAREALSPLGSRAAVLEDLTRFVAERNR